MPSKAPQRLSGLSGTARRGAQRRSAALLLVSSGVSATSLSEMHLRRCDGRGSQRLGPNAGGGAERGLGGCWSSDVVVVRLVAGTASGVAGSWFGVCGS